jgi:hypothetical protein
MTDDMPDGYREFEERFGAEFANDILDRIHDLGRDDKYEWKGPVYLRNFETLDREGGNVLYQGYVKVGPREWEFEIQSGNWVGTEIRTFERMRASGTVPINTLWIFMPIGAIVTRYWIEGKERFLREAFSNFIKTGKEQAIWRTPIR